MAESMNFPATFDEFAEQYKIVDSKEVYTNGTELIPIFRVKQWLEDRHTSDVDAEIERLKEEVHKGHIAFRKRGEFYCKEIEKAKSEAYKEFAEELTNRIMNAIEQSLNNPNGNNYYLTDVYEDIDKILKELTKRSENNVQIY